MKNLSAYYDLLELSPGSDMEQIKRAFRKKAKLYHPDINRAPFAKAHFIRIREAFELLEKDRRQKDYFKAKQANKSYNRYYAGRQQYFSGKDPKGHRSKKEEFDFAACTEGKIIYCTVHLVFILVGLLIFLDPIIIAIQHQFDPFKPLYDSVFTAIITMIFGMVMIWRIGVSLLSFIKKSSG